MTHTLDLDGTAERLRALAAAAEPAVAARPALAGAVLRRAASTRRRRRTVVLLGGGVVVVAAVAAATLPGGGSYFTVIQPSENMAPTVEVGDAVVFGKNLVAARGDVVQAHITQGIEYDSIQRIIGVPGDTVACPAEADGTCAGVLVNGVVLTESYLAQPTEPFQAHTVPPGQVFLLGDNRHLAVDSRQIGPTDLDQIIGVAVRINRDGESLAVPGAPTRPGLGGGDGVDPADEVPPAEESPP